MLRPPLNKTHTGDFTEQDKEVINMVNGAVVPAINDASQLPKDEAAL
jgi:hypothetical protein